MIFRGLINGRRGTVRPCYRGGGGCIALDSVSDEKKTRLFRDKRFLTPVVAPL